MFGKNRSSYRENSAYSRREITGAAGYALLGLLSGLLWLGPAFAGQSPGAVERTKAAVFDFELYDTSLEGDLRGENPVETRRLARISALLRTLMAESGRYSLVDLTPGAKDIAAAGSFRGCNGCDADIAARLGAALSVTGVVQKVSNLILNINIYLRDAATGELTGAMSADIRGNTDRSWERGVRWLVKNRLLAQSR